MHKQNTSSVANVVITTKHHFQKKINFFVFLLSVGKPCLMKMPYFFGVIYASKIPQTVILLKNGVGSENVIQLRLFYLTLNPLCFSSSQAIFALIFSSTGRERSYLI